MASLKVSTLSPSAAEDVEIQTSSLSLRRSRWALRRPHSGLALLGVAAFVYWLVTRGIDTSQRVYAAVLAEIDISQVTCSPNPWYIPYLGTKPPYSGEDLYLPAQAVRDGMEKPAVGILQACSYARYHSILQQLLDSHRDYARKQGYEYSLSTKGPRSEWTKIRPLISKIRSELAKPASERLAWILFADMDTFIVDQDSRLEMMLPPKKNGRAYFLIAENHNGINSGAFFIKVDARSLDFLNRVSKYEHGNKLRFAEQSAMAIVAGRRRMEQTGEMVVIPRAWINFYAGSGRLSSDEPVIQLHWPSRDRKRRFMLPFLARIRKGEDMFSKSDKKTRSSRMQESCDAFWNKTGH